MIKVAPSLLAADFTRLNDEIAMINSSEAAMIHLDVMDGIFVPNISFGFPIIKAIAPLAAKPLDVHLMIVEPQKWVRTLADCGATIMNVHYETTTHLNRVVAEIHDAGMKAAVTLNPATPVEMLTDIIAELDMVLLMSVNPGFGGQKFIEHTIDKIMRLKRLISETGSPAMIEVDGGINLDTGARAANAGADILVTGSAVFKAPDPVAMIDALSSL